MTQLRQAGVHFVDTEGILIDHGNESITLILKGRGFGSGIENGDLLEGAGSPEATALARKQCIDQIDILDGKMRELESTISQLRRAYMMLSGRKWAPK